MLGVQNHSNPTDHLVRWMRSSVHIAIMIGIFVGLFFITSPEETYAHHDDNNLIKTVYHVYLDGEKVGTVHHQNVVEEYLEKRMSAAESTVDGQHVSFNEQVEYVEERMFQPKYDHEAVIKALENKLSVVVEAAAITVEGQVLGYLKSEIEATNLLDQFKEEYVSKETLKQLSKMQKNDIKDEVIEIKDEKTNSNIIDVTFSKNVSVSTKNISVDKIIKPEDVLTLLKKGAIEEKIHVVKEGDVLGSIAEQYNLTTEELLELNPKFAKDSIINIGEKVIVTDYEPYLKVVIKETVTKDESIAFSTEFEKSDDLFKGITKITQDGRNGLKKVKYEIIKENGKIVEQEVIKEEVLEKPVTKVIVQGSKVVPSRGTGEFSWPAVGGYISSHMGTRWGSYHKGIDIARPSNRAILAADNGTVSSAGWDGGYGNKIVINHNNGYRTVYAHLSSIKVSHGQVVQRGQQLGIMGSTGNSTGIHLHFEVYKNGSLVNPMSVLR
jgi:murein DD-endopeptidase MepM/ murein hydrolase activator NlpD